MRPVVVGISTTLAVARWDQWNQDAVILPTGYVEKVERAGGLPILIPTLKQGARDVVAGLDALILSGGEDVDPSNYGERIHLLTRPARSARDRWELDLVRHAINADIPVLGVCRGMQLLNIAFGGTLIQHLPDNVGHDHHMPDKNGFGHHTITLSEDSRIAGIVGTHFRMATHHHQAVRRCGKGVRAVGWADDGTIEAIELTQSKLVLGLQGHPEVGQDLRLFEYLIKSSRPSRMANSNPS